MEILEVINDKEFREEVRDYDGIVLVDFWAPWCGPCKSLLPALEWLYEETEGELKIVKVNIDGNSELATSYGVKTVPTLMVFKDGLRQETRTGLLSKTALMDWVGEYL